MSDPMNDLLDALTRFDPFRDQCRREDAHQFLDANGYYISLAAGAMKRCIEGLGPANEDARRRRANSALDILLEDSGMQIHKSRVLANIVAKTIQEFWLCDRRLAEYFYDTVARKALEMFDRIWRDAIRVSSQIEQRNSLIDISKLRFTTAFLADLYSMEVITEREFIGTVNMLLDDIRSPLLFNIFLFDLLARGLTGNGRKLSPSRWREIGFRWNSISRGHPSSYTNVIIQIFHEDAMQDRKYCAIGWGMEPAGEMLTLCDALVVKFNGRMWDDESERVRLEREQRRVEGMLGGVRI